MSSGWNGSLRSLGQYLTSLEERVRALEGLPPSGAAATHTQEFDQLANKLAMLENGLDSLHSLIQESLVTEQTLEQLKKKETSSSLEAVGVSDSNECVGGSSAPGVDSGSQLDKGKSAEPVECESDAPVTEEVAPEPAQFSNVAPSPEAPQIGSYNVEELLATVDETRAFNEARYASMRRKDVELQGNIKRLLQARR